MRNDLVFFFVVVRLFVFGLIILNISVINPQTYIRTHFWVQTYVTNTNTIGIYKRHVPSCPPKAFVFVI